MSTKRLFVSSVTLGIAALSTGCGATHHAYAPGSFPGERTQAKVTVRFVNPADEMRVAEWSAQRSTKLVSDDKPCNRSASGFVTNGGDGHAEHAVLWGGSYEGDDVTYTPTELSTGSYMFGFFDPDRGAAYQGWIAVNNGGDDVLSALNQWRDTVHEQEEWLAYESKINGKFTSRNSEDFVDFNRQLKSLRQLEGRINAAIRTEAHDRERMNRERNELFGEAQVLLMPGPSSLMQPTTQPAFQESELSAAQGGHAVTKVILAGDFRRSMEKLDRVAAIRQDLQRCRSVFAEEARRLQNRKDYYRITSHLFDHSQKFVANERRMQQVRGTMAQLDTQMTENRRRGHALMFVAGLFAPDEAGAAFDREQSALGRERAVLAERQRQIDMQFNDCSEWNEKRVSLERQRQDLMAEMEDIDGQVRQVEQARVAAAEIRKSAGIIHRQGPTTVLAACLMDHQLPARLADAIEGESMMTIRLQSADGMNSSPSGVTDVSKETQRTSTTILTSDRP